MWFSLGPCVNLTELTQILFLHLYQMWDDCLLYMGYIIWYRLSNGLIKTEVYFYGKSETEPFYWVPNLRQTELKKYCVQKFLHWGRASLCSRGKWVVVAHGVGWTHCPPTKAPAEGQKILHLMGAIHSLEKRPGPWKHEFGDWLVSVFSFNLCKALQSWFREVLEWLPGLFI